MYRIKIVYAIPTEEIPSTHPRKSAVIDIGKDFPDYGKAYNYRQQLVSLNNTDYLNTIDWIIVKENTQS